MSDPGPTDRQKTRYAACCDIGGTKVALALVDSKGSILARDRYLLGSRRDPEHLVQEMATHLAGLSARHGYAWERCVGIGCSAAVMADVEQGLVLTSFNIFGTDRDVPLRDMLAVATNRPTVIEMDAAAACQGEAWRGAGAGVDEFLYVVVGTGIGAGILHAGSIHRGFHGTAGELGHITIVPDGPSCTCGLRGCLEALASGPAIAERAQGAITQGRATQMAAMAGEGNVSTPMVFQAARQGDAVALQVVDDTARYLAIGLIAAIHLLSPETIALGGGVMQGGGDLLLSRIRTMVRQRLGGWVRADELRIVPAQLGDDANLLGVARLVWNTTHTRSLAAI